jgi:hypothetical protein
VAAGPAVGYDQGPAQSVSFELGPDRWHGLQWLLLSASSATRIYQRPAHTWRDQHRGNHLHRPRQAGANDARQRRPRPLVGTRGSAAALPRRGPCSQAKQQPHLSDAASPKQRRHASAPAQVGNRRRQDADTQASLSARRRAPGRDCIEARTGQAGPLWFPTDLEDSTDAEARLAAYRIVRRCVTCFRRAGACSNEALAKGVGY